MKAYLYVSITLCLILFVIELHRVVTNLEKRRKSTDRIVRIRQSDREHFMGSAVILIVFILILIWSS